MKVYKSINEISKDEKSVLTIGTFDGIHEGHKVLFEKLKQYSLQHNLRNVVITFEPHPRTVVSTFDIKLLTTLDEKSELLSQLGIESLLVLKFSKEFSSQSSEEFITNIVCNKIGVEHIIIGHDHKFGKDRNGNDYELIELGNKNNFTVERVEPVKYNDEIISSTKVRNALLNGDVEKANNFLGRNYCFHGTVVKGVSRGTILGFPTANIEVEDKNKLIPKNGVYVVKALVEDEVVYGVMNVGLRPTFADTLSVIIEAHLFEFSKDVYGKTIKIELLKRIRDEIKFNNKEELIYQIGKDKKEAIQFVGKIIN
ncbi:MAG: bifunctional riboflavin kinase/FAD synthetase [Melioribacteraceae bacterium]|jgi:riboflavin kinase/FMN adenylyltransferase|nr:bifunctional riboflavin kinase/FAD synthetase [Melioribacteraceae bacterium]